MQKVDAFWNRLFEDVDNFIYRSRLSTLNEDYVSPAYLTSPKLRVHCRPERGCTPARSCSDDLRRHVLQKSHWARYTAEHSAGGRATNEDLAGDSDDGDGDEHLKELLEKEMEKVTTVDQEADFPYEDEDSFVSGWEKVEEREGGQEDDDHEIEDLLLSLV
jgi:hypothetical protein